MLRKLCALFKISFEENMLSWNQGPHPQDGIWGNIGMIDYGNRQHFLCMKKKSQLLAIDIKIY